MPSGILDYSKDVNWDSEEGSICEIHQTIRGVTSRHHPSPFRTWRRTGRVGPGDYGFYKGRLCQPAIDAGSSRVPSAGWVPEVNRPNPPYSPGPDPFTVYPRHITASVN